MGETNTKAIWSLVAALLSLGVLAAAIVAARHYNEIRVEHAVIAAPLALVLALTAVILGRKARTEHQRTLGRRGRAGFLLFVRLLATVAFLLAVTAALALAVFAVLVLVFE